MITRISPRYTNACLNRHSNDVLNSAQLGPLPVSEYVRPVLYPEYNSHLLSLIRYHGLW